ENAARHFCTRHTLRSRRRRARLPPVERRIHNISGAKPLTQFIDRRIHPTTRLADVGFYVVTGAAEAAPLQVIVNHVVILVWTQFLSSLSVRTVFSGASEVPFSPAIPLVMRVALSPPTIAPTMRRPRNIEIPS